MNRNEIAAGLKKLSEEMKEMAVKIDYYGGFDEWVEHAKELLGAAYVVQQWAEEIGGKYVENNHPADE